MSGAKSFDISGGQKLVAESIVSNRTGKGMVQLSKEKKGKKAEVWAQLDMAQAISFAHSIFMAAHSSEVDAFLLQFVAQKLQVPFREAQIMVGEFRDYREKGVV